MELPSRGETGETGEKRLRSMKIGHKKGALLSGAPRVSDPVRGQTLVWGKPNYASVKDALRA